MRICIIGKISPIQGGVSRENFWWAVALASEGHEVHLVTNSNEVEPEYRQVNGNLAKGLSDTPFHKFEENLHIHHTSENFNLLYIPFANPYVSKLTSRAIEIVEKFNCDLILGYYFEPYGVAAYYTSLISKVPFGLKHAGSDVGKLMLHRDLNYLYQKMCRAADFIFCSSSTFRRFLHLGVQKSKLHILNITSHSKEIYSPNCTPLNMEEHINDSIRELKGSIPKMFFTDFRYSNFKENVTTIGIYGKVSPDKGIFDLIESLKQLKLRGLDFNFLMMLNGQPFMMNRLSKEIHNANIANNTVWIPFIPHWKVPEFIKHCDTVCCLEREFSIPIHQPGTAKEVLMSGCCLIVSNEIANKQKLFEKFVNRENILFVDPKSTDELVSQLEFVIRDTKKAKKIGILGKKLILEKVVEPKTTYVEFSNKFNEILESINLEKAIKDNEHLGNRMHDLLDNQSQTFCTSSINGHKLVAGDEPLMDKVNQAIHLQQYKYLSKHIRTLLIKSLPLTLAFISKKLFFDLCDEFIKEKNFSYLKEELFIIQEFTLFLGASTNKLGLDHECFSEIVRYESIKSHVALTVTYEDCFSLINKIRKKSLTDIESCELELNPNIKIATFQWDMVHLSRVIKECGTNLSFPKQDSTIIFFSLPNKSEVIVRNVSTMIFNILTLAKNLRRADEIVNEIEVQCGLFNRKLEIYSMIRKLIRLGILNTKSNISDFAS